MATPGSDGKNDFPGATPIFDHEHALASVQAGSRRARFSPPMGWQRGAHGAATVLCRVQADFPIRELRCRFTGT